MSSEHPPIRNAADFRPDPIHTHRHGGTPKTAEKRVAVPSGPNGDFKVRIVKPVGATGAPPTILYVQGAGESVFCTLVTAPTLPGSATPSAAPIRKRRATIRAEPPPASVSGPGRGTPRRGEATVPPAPSAALRCVGPIASGSITEERPVTRRSPRVVVPGLIVPFVGRCDEGKRRALARPAPPSRSASAWRPASTAAIRSSSGRRCLSWDILMLNHAGCVRRSRGTGNAGQSSPDHRRCQPCATTPARSSQPRRGDPPKLAGEACALPWLHRQSWSLVKVVKLGRECIVWTPSERTPPTLTASPRGL